MIAIGGFHSRLIDRETLGGQLYAYYCLMLCGSEQISSNCTYALSNMTSIPINELDPITVFPFRVDLLAF